MPPTTVLLQEVDRNPGHVRVKVWAGRNPGARGLSGELVFRTDEWDELRGQLAALDVPYVGRDKGRRPMIEVEV